MTLKIYNTPTGKIEEFVPQDPNRVMIYSCGPTVYDYPHIGNWSGYIYWDVLVRLLKYSNFKVERVINITDVGHLTSDGDTGEDKLEKGAKRDGKTAWEVAKFYTEVFKDGVKKLNLTSPEYMPNATDFVPQQLELIKKLKEKGVTYQTSDGIYFDTSKFPRYANFAKLDLDNLLAGARVDFNNEKRNVSDFALWKFSPVGEKRDMEWTTPNELLDTQDSTPTMGFPGWHIECSAIAMSLLAETIDIHTGGIDAIPVHHTNEIAQSETATGKKFSNYWMHCNFLKVDGSKMSKSLGNFYTLDDLIKRGYAPMDFRMLILQGNYRNEGNFTFDGLTAAKNRLHNWRNVAALRHQIHSTTQNESQKTIVPAYATSQAIVEAIENDLGTPQALMIIDDAFSQVINGSVGDIDRSSFLQLLETIDAVLGLELINTTPDISDEEKRIILERNNARAQKDWKKSDNLRDKLAKQGIVIRDTAQSSLWEYQD